MGQIGYGSEKVSPDHRLSPHRSVLEDRFYCNVKLGLFLSGLVSQVVSRVGGLMKQGLLYLQRFSHCITVIHKPCIS